MEDSFILITKAIPSIRLNTNCMNKSIQIQRSDFPEKLVFGVILVPLMASVARRTDLNPGHPGNFKLNQPEGHISKGLCMGISIFTAYQK